MSGVRSRAHDDFNDSITDGTSTFEAVGFTACTQESRIGRMIKRDLILALAGWRSEAKHESGSEAGNNDENDSEGVPRCRGDVLLPLEHEEALEVADEEGGHRHCPEDCRVPEEWKS